MQVVSQFASGEFLQGIKTIVGRGMKVLMGSYSGSIAKKENYLVSVGPLGGVFRIDYFLYSYRCGWSGNHLPPEEVNRWVV